MEKQIEKNKLKMLKTMDNFIKENKLSEDEKDNFYTNLDKLFNNYLTYSLTKTDLKRLLIAFPKKYKFAQIRQRNKEREANKRFREIQNYPDLNTREFSILKNKGK